MVILISVEQPDLSSPVDDRFGRAAWFLLVNTETLAWQALENPARNNRGGAGVAAAQLAVDKKVEVAISGDFGPNASAALGAAGIQMIRFPKAGLSGKEVVELFQQGVLTAS